MEKLKNFNYKFDQGPLNITELKKENFREGNCRLAVQYYLYKIQGLYLKPSLVLNPEAYYRVGKFIVEEGKFNKKSAKLLQKGDIIYAERIKSKNIPLSRRKWVVGLHSAIYLGNNRIWHSTAIEGKSCYWTFSKLTKHYKPIAAKRVLKLD